MEEINDLIEQRIKKLNDLRELQIDPYGGKFEPEASALYLKTTYASASKEALEADPVFTSAAGRNTAPGS